MNKSLPSLIPSTKTSLGVKVFSLLIAAVFIFTGCKRVKTEEEKYLSEDGLHPNFIVIFTDDQGYGDLGSYGGDHLSTPNLDKMAKEGARLTSFYAAAAVCTPSRAALLTGSYPKRNSMASRVLLAGDSLGLHPDEITIAEVLKSKGYVTGIIGKWHLGDQAEFLPTSQGFDEFFGLPYSHDIHPWHPNKEKYNFPDLPLLEGEEVIELNPDMNLLSQRISDRAVSFIKQNKDTSFFLYLPHPLPHRPLYASPNQMLSADDPLRAALAQEDANVNYKLRDQIYPQAIATIDEAVGEIMSALTRNGLDKNTLVIFTSDNGPARGGLGSTGGLRGKKGETLEGGMRMPTLAWMPGKIAEGRACDQVLSTMDLLPTFASLAGAEIPQDRVIDGRNIWHLIASEKRQKEPSKPFFYFNNNQLEAVRYGEWKYHRKNDEAFLYNLSSDKGEDENVIFENPEIEKELLSYFKDMERELGKRSSLSEKCRPVGFVKDPKVLEMQLPKSILEPQ